MTRLYCPDCSEYLEGGDGECHDCSCGWKQPVETFEDDNTTLQVAYNELCEELEDSQRKLEVAAEFCRQYQIEIAQLKAKNKRLGDCYIKINSMYWNDEIFVVKNGEGFYTDEFVDLFVEF